jgi:hypothetical protein
MTWPAYPAIPQFEYGILRLVWNLIAAGTQQLCLFRDLQPGRKISCRRARDSTARIWDLESNREIHQILGVVSINRPPSVRVAAKYWLLRGRTHHIGPGFGLFQRGLKWLGLTVTVGESRQLSSLKMAQPSSRRRATQPCVFGILKLAASYKGLPDTTAPC